MGGIEVNSVQHQDCMVGMKMIDSNCVDLIFADPPYNIGVMCGTQSDILPDYADWCLDWMNECCRLLRDGGSLWIATSQNWLGMFLQKLDSIDELVRRSIVIWHRETPNYGAKRKLSVMYEPLIYLTKGDDYTFNLADVMVPSKQAGRKTDKWMKTNSAEIGSTKNPTDVWEIASAFHSKVEYTGFRGQKPTALLDRIILLSSNEDDVVLDPFMGSGTTAISCIKHQRNYVGFEYEQEHFTICQDRIAEYNANALPTLFTC
ncbi:hypothetical protein KKE60_05150 [Patescibacteria group bacterium]|nr:hypothetical protein [Patescibacteria group bacterium]